jgi:hypothetical protein
MNTELIQKLHAKCIVREVRGTHAFNRYVVDRFDSDKFAELIVRECDRYARSVWEHGPLLGRDLLIHFGVEEMSDE